MNGPSNPLRVVAIGASAGGVQALKILAASLPRQLPAAVTVVLHVPPYSTSALAAILDRSGPLPAVSAARDDKPLEMGVIYVAQPDRHLLLDDHQLRNTRGPTENGHRPAINALFRSIAVSAGPAGIGILLSGVLDDGVAGLAAIRSRGGVTIVQDPADAMFAMMPNLAIAAGLADHVATAAQMGPLLKRLLAADPEEQTMPGDRRLELENHIAMGSRFNSAFDPRALGSPSGFTCPDCSGSLLDVGSGQYRCHVGHAWSVDALLGARDAEVENALWTALRSLDEKARLSRSMASHSPTDSRTHIRYMAAAREAQHAAEVLRTHFARVMEEQERVMEEQEESPR